MRRPRVGDYVRLALWDAAQNWRHASGDRRFLVVRDPRVHPMFYDVLLRWLAFYFPDLRALFELRALPCYVRDWSRYALHVPWLQDPVQAWSPTAYRLANRLAAHCDRHGIPVVNRVDRLPNASRATSAELIAGTGLRTPKVARIENEDEFRETRLGVPLPLFVREAWGHGGKMARAETDAEVRALSLEHFARPVAIELVDLRSPDGLYRKYRYVLAGDVGVPQSIHAGMTWRVRGSAERSVYAEPLVEEELAYTGRPEPNHDRFVAAREALGLDFVAFDYGYDADGSPVVWEVNPYPFLHVSAGRRRYRVAPTARVLAAMTKLYLTRAGMVVPRDLDELLAALR